MEIGTLNYLLKDKLEAIEVLENFVIRLKLKKPSSSIKGLLTSVNLTPVSPTSYSEFKDKFNNENFIGTGPYFLKSFNFSSDMHFKSVNDMSKKILKILKNKMQITYDPIFIGKEAESIKLSNEKAKRELGWHPIYNQESMIRYTTEWYQKVIDGESPLIVSEKLLDRYLEDCEKFYNVYDFKRKGKVNA